MDRNRQAIMDQNHNGAAGRVADNMKDKLGQIAADAARQAVESNLDLAAESVENRYGAILDPLAKTADCLTGFVRSRPLTALLLTAGVCFLIGRR